MASNTKKYPDFFKVFLPAHCSERMCIPRAFMAHVKGLLPEKIILRSRRGKLWHVEAKQIENDVFLLNGWQKFVKENTIVVGDVLLFRYDNRYVMDIIILGRTGCEKEETEAYIEHCQESSVQGGRGGSRRGRLKRMKKEIDSNDDEDHKVKEECDEE